MDVVLLFPGQGSQKPGMGRDLAGAIPAAREAFEEVDAALDDRLSAICFEGPPETLTLTHNAQPALLAHGAAVWAVIRHALAGRVRAAAGHSLGEFSAWYAAGGLALRDAIRLVRRRGALMSEAGAVRPGTMAAILGEMDTPIEATCRAATAAPDGGIVVPANYNTPGQVVISGEVGGVEKAMSLCRAAGARRAMLLNVSGAFHSPLMEPARDGLSLAIATAGLHDPDVPVYANVTAAPVCSGEQGRALLLEQLTAPVRWTQLIQRLAADFPDALYVEMGPGAVLTGLVRKIAPSLQSAHGGTLADVESLLARLA
jgi:[acyl-carrier-protein] S-malonyltransferase